MFWSAGQLFQLNFTPLPDVPVYHSDVRVWEVSRAGQAIGVFYLDPYARKGKQSGAWMSDYRPQQNIDRPVLPLVSNNCNYLKPGDGGPTLISWDDAVTLFHEFGHGLHGLLSKVHYPSQSGTSVARDYVEFPSQLFEHWLKTPEVLGRFAVHYQTGQPIPTALVEKIERAAKFNQGFATVEYLSSALLDMQLHLSPEGNIDAAAFEQEVLRELGMPREMVMRHRLPHFSHIFSSDGYSAGYYSYLWADALTADAAEAFDALGTYFDSGTAARLHDYVLSVGDTLDPAAGFRLFRGRDVDTRALLRKRGFPAESKQ
jgi:peptidyl-dipeptidase Dcp